MIEITRRLIWFDLETTGPDPEKDRIVSLGFWEYKPRTPEGDLPEPRSYHQVLNPGIPISKEATEKHGITDAQVAGCQICGLAEGDTDAHQLLGDNPHTFKRYPTFRELAPSLLLGFKDCDYGGYNCKIYDLPLLANEFERAGHQWSFGDANVVDVLRLWGKLKPRTLSDAVEHFLGRQPTDAHSADGDIKDTIEVFEAMLTQFRGKIPATVAGIHELVFPRDPNAIDPDGKIIWQNGVAVINFGKKWKGTPLIKMTRRDLDWIVNTATGMSREVKQICRDALAGKFPEKKA